MFHGSLTILGRLIVERLLHHNEIVFVFKAKETFWLEARARIARSRAQRGVATECHPYNRLLDLWSNVFSSNV